MSPDTGLPARPERTRIYLDMIMDSRRWDGFKVRPGDVIVSTAPKCGTTWTLKLCAMLLNGGPDLPMPLSDLGPWLDQRIRPQYPLFAELEAREGRRFFKTHTPLDGLPFAPQARYVVCGRDPRDAFLSIVDQQANTSLKFWRQQQAAAGHLDRTDDPPPAPDPNAVFPRWATVGQFPWMKDGGPFQSVFSFNETWWKFRHLPNVCLLHYRDLSQDLEGELRRLAVFLDTPVDAAVWPAILEAGTLAAMREDADQNAPGGQRGIWKRNADFFRSGRLGQWRERLSPENQALYEEVNRDRFDPALKAWLEQGRAALGG